jgi:lipopolysaccharide/colanic/teichoic acid biosynthesis glycosyltransferase
MQDDGMVVVAEPADAPQARPRRPARGLPFDPIAPLPAAGRAWRGKRAVDFVGSFLLLLIALPLLVVVAVVVKLTSPGPVFFRQRRVGRNGVDFPMLKFRTMEMASEARLRADAALQELFVRGGHKIPSHLDPRITRVGKVLRRLSLDELPQLLNVLWGHMSIVGPRPVERSQLDRDYGAYREIYLALRPGLTGLWQVSGRSTVAFPERARLDDRYLATCGPWNDAKILLRTPLVVLTGLGAD